MRVFAALTLLLAASCTFDYGALKGTAGQGEGGVGDEAGARDARDAIVDRPVISDVPEDSAVDVLADLLADADIGPVDAREAAEVAADVPAIVVEDAAPEEDVPTGGVGGSGSTDTGGAGGSSSFGTGGADGGATGGIVSSGDAGGGAGGTTFITSTARTGGQGGTAGTGGAGGMGGTSIDGGVDGPALDASVDASVVDGDDGDATGDALSCTPGEGLCVGNSYCQCNAAGTGCIGALQECVSTSSCSPSLGGCVIVDPAPFNPNDTTGFSKNSTSSVLKLNFYSVTGARRLLRIEQYMTPVAGAPLHWVIYRSSTKEGSYALDKTYDSTATTSADGYQSSPIIDYVLENTYYYAIGVWWESGAVSYWYHTSAATFPIALSAAGGMSLLSGLSPGLTTAVPPTAPTTTSWSGSTTLYYPQRLTTR